MKAEDGIMYRCQNCQQTITVYVQAKVRCKRCGRAMKVVLDLEPLKLLK